MANSEFRLPRYIGLKTAEDGHMFYLTLDLQNGVPYLSFKAAQMARLTTHEVVYNADLSGVAMFRAPNRRFWRRDSSNHIVADREGIPDPSRNKDCYFRVTRLSSNVMLLESLVNDTYLKRSLSTNRLIAPTRSIDVNTKMQVIVAADTAVTLPRYIMLFGDNRKYVGDHREKAIDWLKFNKDTPRLAVAHEVIPLIDGNVMMRNMNLNKFWRRSPNWIWADATASNAPANKDCHFDVIKVSDTLVAFKSVANNLFLKRYTDYWESCLCAIGASIDDITARFVLSEAVLDRRLSNIRYLLELAEVYDVKPLIVGSGSMRNVTNFVTTLEVLVSYTKTVTTSETWSTSNTFSTSVTTSFSIGVPEVASVSGGITIGHERTISTEMGKTTEETVQFQATFKVENVPSGVEVMVTVECTTAKCRVPFTYSSRDTRIDGVYLPTVDNNVDGVFDGVSVFNIKGVVDTVPPSGTPKKILPVMVSRISAFDA